MTDQTIDLDRRRGMAAQRATDLRRQRIEVEEDLASLKARQEKLETYLIAAPAGNWAEAVEKTRYLLGLFSETLGADDLRRRRLVKALLADYDRLLGDPPESP